MRATQIRDALLSQLAGARAEEVAAIPDLERMLAAQWVAGAAAWPTVAIDPEVYAGALAEKLQARADEPAARIIHTMPASDLYLAAACAAGNCEALAAFRSALLPVVRRALAKLRIPEPVIEETEQRVLIAVLVGDAPPPRPRRPAIASYNGRGRLHSFVRSIGIRIGRRTIGSRPPPTIELAMIAAGAATGDPELALVEARYREPTHRALVAAFGALTDHQRTVLRHYHVDGMTIDDLAALYAVDRATTARWIVRARSRVLSALRARLMRALAASPHDVDQLLGALRGSLDIGLCVLDG